MSKKQLFALFFCSLVFYTVGSLAFALFPVYTARLGADPAMIGNYFASLFVAVTAGTVAGGWLSDRFQHRKPLIIMAGLAVATSFFLVSRVAILWHLIVLLDVAGFFAGITSGAINILAGLFAEETERGKVFGALALTIGLGALIGGLTSGPIADRWGFPALFVVSGLCWIFLSVTGLLLQDKVPAQVRQEAVSTLPRRPTLGGAFYLLLLANIIIWVSGSMGNLGRPLQMDKLGFDPAAITGVVAIGGAVSLPFPFLVGWLSDRVSRYRLMALCVLASALGLAVLAGSTLLWHFWVASILGASSGISAGVGSALVTDLVPQESLGAGLSRYSATNWVGSIIGFAGTGNAIQLLGTTTTFIAGAVLTLIAIGLLVQIQRTRRLALA